jgi:hypothetical protein
MKTKTSAMICNNSDLCVDVQGTDLAVFSDRFTQLFFSGHMHGVSLVLDSRLKPLFCPVATGDTASGSSLLGRLPQAEKPM